MCAHDITNIIKVWDFPRNQESKKKKRLIRRCHEKVNGSLSREKTKSEKERLIFNLTESQDNRIGCRSKSQCQ